MKSAARYLGYAQLGGAMAIVGSSVVVGKLVIAHLPIFLVLGLRFGVASLILVPLAMWVDNGLPSLSRRDVAILLGQALSGVVMFGLLLLVGLKYTSAASAGIITGTLPIMTGVLATLVLSERMTLRKVTAMLLSTMGVIAIVGLAPGNSTAAKAPLLGNAIILLAVFGEAIFAILSKMTRAALSPLATAAVLSTISFVLFLPFAIYEAQSFEFAQTQWEDWALILYLSVVVTAVAFFLWYAGISKVDASVAGVLTSVLPVSAMVLSGLFLSEAIAYAQLIGAVCVVVAIVIVSTQRRPAVAGLISEGT